jgi:phosphatidylinositol alpha-1,6-mannosyltransferase
MTRALWVTNDLPPRSGGIEQFLGNLLASSNPTTTWVLASDQPGAAAHDATLPYAVRRIGRRPLLPGPTLLRQVRNAARAHGAEVVVFGATWPLGELAAHLNLPCVALSHGLEAGMARAGLGPLIRRATRGLDGLGILSAYTRTAIAPCVGDPTVLHQLPPGVDLEAFHPGADGAGIRSRHGLGGRQPLAVCVSRLVSRKGQDVLIEGWRRVQRRVPDAHLLIVGTGPRRVALQRRGAELGLGASVTFAGEVAWADLPAYHAAADVFAMPCRTRLGGLDVEGLGIVYLEAQACGTPVVAGRSGGAPEAVVDGQTGHVVDGTDVEAVADAVADLLSDPFEAALMGERGRAFVARYYSWPMVMGRLEAMLRQAAH